MSKKAFLSSWRKYPFVLIIVVAIILLYVLYHVSQFNHARVQPRDRMQVNSQGFPVFAHAHSVTMNPLDNTKGDGKLDKRFNGGDSMNAVGVSTLKTKHDTPLDDTRPNDSLSVKMPGKNQHEATLNAGASDISYGRIVDPRKGKDQDETRLEMRADTIRSLGTHSYRDMTYYPPDCRNKLLVYVCYPRLPCGGLADRQKGIISTFILALLTNRTFVIDTIVPCNIEHVLPPHLYDWMKCRRTIKDRVNDTLTINDFMLGFRSPFTFKERFNRYNGSDLWTESVVKLRVNSRIHRIMKSHRVVQTVLPWLISKPEEDLIKHTMELLFKHSTRLSETLHNFKEVYFRNRYTVCAHMRVGVKGVDPSFLKTDHIRNILVFLSSYLAGLEKPYALYIASDSSEAKGMAKTSFQTAITLNTTIEHIDATDDTSCKPTFTTVLEQVILSQCDAILMTGSGFSRLAVLIGGRAEDIFLMYDQYPKHKRTKDVDNYTLHSLAEAFMLG